MKKIVRSGIIACLFFLACTKDKELVVEEKVDYNKESLRILDSIRPKLLGTWRMSEVNVQPYRPTTTEIGITKDTTFLNFATLHIHSIDSSSPSLKDWRDEVTGRLEFKTKRYPVGFRMMPTAERLYRKIGPQVIGLFEFRYPVGSHITEPEESYLWSLTLIGSNYDMEISPDGKTMVWTGLQRAVRSIKFEKM